MDLGRKRKKEEELSLVSGSLLPNTARKRTKTIRESTDNHLTHTYIARPFDSKQEKVMIRELSTLNYSINKG